MADETTTTWANLLRESKGPLVEALRWDTVLLSEYRRDKNPRRWAGKQVTIPIILAPQQGGGFLTSETASLNTPHVHEDTQAVVKSAIVSVPVTFSTQVIEQAKADETSWAQVVPTKMRMAQEVMSRILNEQMVSAQQGLLASVASATGSPGLVLPITAASFNQYQLYAGRIVDILTRSTGVAASRAGGSGGGLSARIASTQPTASPPTVTFDTNSFGAGSGNITFTANEGLYIEGSYFSSAASNCLASLADATATSGTFQNINKANVPAWQGTDASPSSASDLSMAILDKAERKVRTLAGGNGPSFYLGDPAVIDKYQQGLSVQARWQGDKAQLDTGFTGISYRDKVLVPEYDCAPNLLFGVERDDAVIYSLDDGPDWDEKTGSMFQRFGTRSLTVEAWLIWMLQVGYLRCNTFVRIASLNQAA